MAVQTYLVHLHEADQHADDSRTALADLIVHVGGFVLMATNAGSLIAAFDECWVPTFTRQRSVAFCGPVRIDPNGAAADRLRHMFARNVAAQLAGRRTAPEQQTVSPTAANARHRPWQWHRPDAGATGVSIYTQHKTAGAA